MLHQSELGLSVESPPPIPPKKKHDYPKDLRYVWPQIYCVVIIYLPISIESDIIFQHGKIQLQYNNSYSRCYAL
jgi:hypothetical protein